MQSTITENPKETKRFAAELAKKLIEKKNRRALIVALKGELGAGKTTFIKGFSKALGIREKILSPTFVLIHKHKLKIVSLREISRREKNFKLKILYHIDAYRLNSGKDLMKLGIKEIFANLENIVLIEWADRVKKIIPKTAIWIYFSHLEKNTRRITIK